MKIDIQESKLKLIKINWINNNNNLSKQVFVSYKNDHGTKKPINIVFPRLFTLADFLNIKNRDIYLYLGYWGRSNKVYSWDLNNLHTLLTQKDYVKCFQNYHQIVIDYYDIIYILGEDMYSHGEIILILAELSSKKYFCIVNKSNGHSLLSLINKDKINSEIIKNYEQNIKYSVNKQLDDLLKMNYDKSQLRGCINGHLIRKQDTNIKNDECLRCKNINKTKMNNNYGNKNAFKKQRTL